MKFGQSISTNVPSVLWWIYRPYVRVPVQYLRKKLQKSIAECPWERCVNASWQAMDGLTIQVVLCDVYISPQFDRDYQIVQYVFHLIWSKCKPARWNYREADHRHLFISRTILCRRKFKAHKSLARFDLDIGIPGVCRSHPLPSTREGSLF